MRSTDERILRLCDLVDYEVDPRSTFPRHYTGEVQISLKDGRKLVHREALNRGCADRPLSNADIVDKFTGNARMSLSARQADEVREAVLGLEEAADIRAGHRPHLPGERRADSCSPCRACASSPSSSTAPARSAA